MEFFQILLLIQWITEDPDRMILEAQNKCETVLPGSLLDHSWISIPGFVWNSYRITLEL